MLIIDMLTYEKIHTLADQPSPLWIGGNFAQRTNISSWLAISHQKSGLKLCHWHMAVLYSVIMIADSDSDICFALNNYPRVQVSKKLELYV